jgi:hypothetical protein
MDRACPRIVRLVRAEAHEASYHHEEGWTVHGDAGGIHRVMEIAGFARNHGPVPSDLCLKAAAQRGEPVVTLADALKVWEVYGGRMEFVEALEAKARKAAQRGEIEKSLIQAVGRWYEANLDPDCTDCTPEMELGNAWRALAHARKGAGEEGE